MMFSLRFQDLLDLPVGRRDQERICPDQTDLLDEPMRTVTFTLLTWRYSYPGHSLTRHRAIIVTSSGEFCYTQSPSLERKGNNLAIGSYQFIFNLINLIINIAIAKLSEVFYLS